MMPALASARQRAFTLLEMLVAIALLGVLGMLTWRGLDQVISHRERIDRESQEIGRMVRTLLQLESDLAQRAPDSVVPAAAQAPAAMPRAIDILVARDGGVTLSILRCARESSGPLRLHRVRYLVASGSLLRESSQPGTTWPPDSAFSALPILGGVRRLSVRVLANGVWNDASLVGGPALGGLRVTALEVTIERHNSERYVRVFAL
jgi:general secretion pathway protein J